MIWNRIYFEYQKTIERYEVYFKDGRAEKIEIWRIITGGYLNVVKKKVKYMVIAKERNGVFWMKKQPNGSNHGKAYTCS